MNPDRMLNEDVMNEQSSLKLLWEILYMCCGNVTYLLGKQSCYCVILSGLGYAL